MFTAAAGMLAQGALGIWTKDREGYFNQRGIATAHLVIGYVTLAGNLDLRMPGAEGKAAADAALVSALAHSYGPEEVATIAVTPLVSASQRRCFL